MNPTYNFTNQVALVTGASAGIGLAAAKAFAEAGAAVVLVDVNETALSVEVEKMTSAGHKALKIVCDVSDEVQVKAMIKKTIDTF